MVNHLGNVLSQSLGTRAIPDASAIHSAEPDSEADTKALRDAFDSFVGETFYGHMLASMRQTVGKPAYFHGGRAEEVFQKQLDQLLAQNMTEASADQFTGPMFQLFNMNRKA